MKAPMVRPLGRTELAQVAPNYEAMRTAIATCERIDEIADLADQAVAAQAYYRQSQDVDNEMHASRIRARAERRLGEILKRMAANGERVTRSTSAAKVDLPTLEDLGIPQGRASRAMQLADVPEEQFEAALAKPEVAQPRKILREVKQTIAPPAKRPIVPINQTLSLWGKVRDLGIEIESGAMPDLKHWRENLQPFQLAHLEKYIPVIIKYLSTIQKEI